MDLIEVLNDDVSEHSINLISRKAGVSEEQARAGIFAAIPAVLAGLMKNSTARGTSSTVKLLRDYTTGPADHVASTDFDQSESVFDRGVSMLGDLFGDDTDSVAIAVSDASGISRKNSAALLAMVTPIIIMAVSRLMSNENWSVPDLIRHLFDHKSHIISLLPGTLSSTLGMPFINIPDLKRDY